MGDMYKKTKNLYMWPVICIKNREIYTYLASFSLSTHRLLVLIMSYKKHQLHAALNVSACLNTNSMASSC